MATSKFSIILQGGECREEFIAAATAAIKPGHCVVLNGVTLNNVKKQIVNAEQILLAYEDAQQGNTWDTAYADAAVVFCAAMKSGDVGFFRAAAATYTQGQSLQLIAAGQVGAVAAGAARLVAEPLDSSDQPVLSLAVSADGLLRCRVI